MNVQFVTGRLTKLLMVAALLLVPVSSARMMAAARSFDQSLVTVKAKDASLSDILWEIHKQTDFTFVYSTDDIERVVLPSLDLREVTLQKALESCLDSNGLTYTVNGEVITIKPAPSSVKQEGEPVKQDKKYYTGSVVDDAGIPVAGANILVKGAGIGSVSDAEGNFSIQYDVDSAIVVVSFIGFTTREVRMSPGIPAEIILMQDLNMMDEVIVTGYGTFKKSAYAGSASNVRAEKSRIFRPHPSPRCSRAMLPESSSALRPGSRVRPLKSISGEWVPSMRETSRSMSLTACLSVRVL